MSDRITTDDVAKVARLARLDLTPDEIERATAQLGDMLDHFADIDALDLGDLAPMTQPYQLVNVMRDDVVRPGVDRDEVLAAAPAGRGRPLPGAADHRAGGLMAGVYPHGRRSPPACAPATRHGGRRARGASRRGIAAGEGEIHAFNLVTRRRGPRAAAAVDAAVAAGR